MRLLSKFKEMEIGANAIYISLGHPERSEGSITLRSFVADFDAAPQDDNLLRVSVSPFLRLFSLLPSVIRHLRSLAEVTP